MTHSIIESYEHTKDSWLTRVAVTNTASIYINTPTRPTQEEANKAGRLFLDIQADELAEANRQKAEEEAKNVTPD